MGINTEMVYVLATLERAGELAGKSRIVELGSQDVSAHPDSLRAAERSCFGMERGGAPENAAAFYRRYGLTDYACLDAGGSPTEGRMIADLNEPVPGGMLGCGPFDVVTNLGTSEHCFNQAAVFANVHELCAVGGLMIHVLCAQGLVNHGYFNYHPRMVHELAGSNRYDILNLWFTVDFTSHLIDYNSRSFREYDDRDVMLYVVLRKMNGSPFRLPFDTMFASQSKLKSYDNICRLNREQFSPYVKGNWSNATARDAFMRAPPPPRAALEDGAASGSVSRLTETLARIRRALLESSNR